MSPQLQLPFKLPHHSQRIGNLTLTVKPYSYAGHGEVPNVWVASVDIDVPEYDTTANVARERWGRKSPAHARAIAIVKGQAMLADAVQRFATTAERK